SAILIVFFFFFSSRRRHTRFSRDWSSDVCSSDLRQWFEFRVTRAKGTKESRPNKPLVFLILNHWQVRFVKSLLRRLLNRSKTQRSEERRVGKECRSRRTAYQ